MKLRLAALSERSRASLFLIPMMGVVIAIVLAAVTIGIDSALENNGADLPLGFTSTVDSARSLLSTVAGATISFAAIAFSVSLLIIQQASNQYSPRVVHTLFRDPFNKRVMGLVVGTFTYCLVVLRSVRSALEEGGDAVIPNLSVAVAVVLGILTILAIVAFINHSAHSMDISNILDDVQDEAVRQIRREWTVAEPPDEPWERPHRPSETAHTVRFDRNGWVQQLDIEHLTRCVPAGHSMWVDAYPGRYAIEGTPICGTSFVPDDADDLAHEVRSALSIGDTRTMQQDVSFGLRQLADVALKALSPGINDPTTAQDAIFHSAAVLAELLRRDPPSLLRSNEDGSGRVVLLQQLTHDDLIRLAFDEVRHAAASLPSVCVYLLESLELLMVAIPPGLDSRGEALVRQARLVVAGASSADLVRADREMVEEAYVKRFGPLPVEQPADHP